MISDKLDEFLDQITVAEKNCESNPLVQLLECRARGPEGRCCLVLCWGAAAVVGETLLLPISVVSGVQCAESLQVLHVMSCL